MTRILAAILVASFASPAVAQTSYSCTVSTKCGKSGMCVTADEPLRVEADNGRFLIEGIIARSEREFHIDSEGRFLWRPDPKATHAPGMDVDQMAVQFSGECNS